MNTLNSLLYEGKTSGIGQITDETLRRGVLQHAKDFKISWVKLGQALYSVWNDKIYKLWGYEKFEDYTEKEIGLKKQVAMKLLKTYYFLESEEPAYLKQEYSESTEAGKIPGYETVNALRLAKNRKELPKEEFDRLKEAVFEKGKDATLIRKDLTTLMKQRKELVGKFIQAYRQYCWNVQSINDLKLAPFHLLATEGKVYFDKTHQWHMETLSKICKEDQQILLEIPFKIVDVTDPSEETKAIEWWEELTSKGGEGMVIKPLEFVIRGRKGVVQPALKCRGKEYLRIIYGPEYSIPENLSRLRSRSLGGKRSLAQREFALGVEALERFVRQEPLRRVHECVFGVLALESEPVDPRL